MLRAAWADAWVDATWHRTANGAGGRWSSARERKSWKEWGVQHRRGLQLAAGTAVDSGPH